ncbi:hypothetical protein D3C72_1845620 [compost metagenome]
MPQNTLNKLGINGATVYVSGRNLYTWTNWIGWDPEARDNTRGSDNAHLNYPMVRTYVLGVNLTF